VALQHFDGAADQHRWVRDERSFTCEAPNCSLVLVPLSEEGAVEHVLDAIVHEPD
jgi:hypothetical protein